MSNCVDDTSIILDITQDAETAKYTIENLTIVSKEANAEKVNGNGNYDLLDRMDLVKCFGSVPKPLSRLERVKKSLMRGDLSLLKQKAKKLSIDLIYYQFSHALYLVGFLLLKIKYKLVS